MTIFMKLIFSALLLLNLYLFVTIGDATKADIINQSQLIPTRISKVIQIVNATFQDRINYDTEVESL